MGNHNGPAPSPVAFMVMPFREKATGTQVVNAPSKVDFDLLWHKAMKPGIEACGYRAFRADEDWGSVILKDMIERLVAADLVVADVSVANANVYYELGLRHAAKETGCVMVAANWARPVFDISQITRFTYPLKSQKVSDEEAEEIRACIVKSLPDAARQSGPVHSLIPGYPAIDKDQLKAFREHNDKTYAFQANIRRIELLEDKGEQARERKAVVESCLAAPALLPTVVTDLLKLIRKTGDWQEVLDYVYRLPDDLRRLRFVREQTALALSKEKKHAEAIAELEGIVRAHGSSPESLGIIGGSYKRLYDETKDKQWLNKAIEAYEEGWRLDLSAYYPGCNLPLLLRERGEPGDAQRAGAINHVIIEACEAARALGRADQWLNPTLLGAAFMTGEVEKARQLLTLIRREGAPAWQIKSTRDDLQRCLDQLTDGEGKAGLTDVFEELNTLITLE